ncbi:GTPase IMAP family member 4 isoform X1 [Patella vulgata]|uniref:GTPase IMAP family member 4 isoform X1 n=1 Tax=Patella vulgata TaxID=6465 RepID=UPI00217FAB92|nr:GTPase IMAP family member 4 isoform X1 [Patella vulgata]
MSTLQETEMEEQFNSMGLQPEIHGAEGSSKTKEAMAASSHDLKEIRIVMVGKTGVGKSGVGNSLLKYKAFVSAPFGISETRQCEFGTRMLEDGNKLVVVDTPGLFDTRKSNQETETEIGICITLSSPGPHVIFFVMSIGRFTAEERDTINNLKHIFGKQVMNFVVCVFTSKDKLHYNQITLDKYIENCPDAVKSIIKECNGRCVAINNVADPVNLANDVEDLLHAVRETIKSNRGKYYTGAMYEAAEKVYQEYLQQIEEEKNKRERELDEKERKLEEEMKEKTQKLEEEMEKQRLKDEEDQRKNEEEKQKLLERRRELERESDIKSQEMEERRKKIEEEMASEAEKNRIEIEKKRKNLELERERQEKEIETKNQKIEMERKRQNQVQIAQDKETELQKIEHERITREAEEEQRRLEDMRLELERAEEEAEKKRLEAIARERTLANEKQIFEAKRKKREQEMEESRKQLEKKMQRLEQIKKQQIEEMRKKKLAAEKEMKRKKIAAQEEIRRKEQELEDERQRFRNEARSRKPVCVLL